jgi:uncharacterized membrane protein
MSFTPYLRSLEIGAVAGLRSMTAPAATLRSAGGSWAQLATALAAGEYLVDKLPQAPSRLSPPALIFRILSGGYCGGELAVRRNASRLGGSALGATAAVAAAYGGYALRKYLTKTLRLPDFPIAALEDGVAVLVARASVAP